jgi:hypothetical protein
MSTRRSGTLARGWLALFVGNAEGVQVRANRIDGCVDVAVRAVAGDVDRPRGENVAEAVELSRDAEEVDDVRMPGIDGTGVVLERLPQRGAVPLEQARMLPEGPLGPPHEIQDVVDALGLRLGIADERGAQAPVVHVRMLREVDQLGQGGRLDLGGHGDQRTKPYRGGARC